MASGIALGINYLHTARERPLIHGDLKMKNVLISDGFKPKVSDVASLDRVFPRYSHEIVFRCVGCSEVCSLDFDLQDFLESFLQQSVRD